MTDETAASAVNDARDPGPSGVPLGERLAAMLGRAGTPLADASRWFLTVVGTESLTPRMRRIALRGEGVGSMAYAAGQDLMFRIPTVPGAVGHRRYTIRMLERDRDIVSVDALIHGEGAGSRWMETAAPGDEVEAIGPRGAIRLDAAAPWHCFLGDDSAVPATLAMIEALPAGAHATAFLEVDDDNRDQAFVAPPAASVDLAWLDRGGAAPGHATVLVDELARLELPPGPGHAYLAGEAKTVRALRAALLGRGLAADRISFKAYWTLGKESDGT